jgi:hypothetical protein
VGMERGKASYLLRASGLGPIASFLPILLAALLLASLAMAAAPPPGEWFFQSPVSPVAPGPTRSPSVSQATATGPALVSVPTPANFVPWIIGIVVVGAIVGAVLFWRRAKGEEGEDA